MNYQKDKLDLSAIHFFLRQNYGKPTNCSSTECNKKSKIFEWCKKTESEYTRNPEDYIWLCRACHRKYDLTPEKKEKAMKNLFWVKGLDQPNKKYTPCVECDGKYYSKNLCELHYGKQYREKSKLGN